MPTRAPWHLPGQHVYHTNTECPGGKPAAGVTLREGTDGRPQCHDCARLDRAGK